MTNNEPVIKVRKLKIAFGSKVVLDEIDLDLYPGETLAVIGPSGTGKSTVLKVMTGLLTPTSGSVIIQGQETNGFDESQWDELRKH
ncbi:MAG: ATP-binding cassette domain-containing protein, partial [Phascolarctobacterium sp.]|nr:ATP-binding cassette domain-containing protein [Phascolarctobacterium sp.]